MGMTTQAEAAKRKPAGYIELTGCARWVPPACIVMGSGPDTYVLYGSPIPIPWYTRIKVYGVRAADPSVGLCWGKQVRVLGWKPDSGSCIFR
jgi:hypothetical protein